MKKPDKNFLPSAGWYVKPALVGSALVLGPVFEIRLWEVDIDSGPGAATTSIGFVYDGAQIMVASSSTAVTFFSGST